MLVLSRKLGEKIIIGEGADAVKLVVVSIDRGVIRLGVEAPKHVRVDREEVRQQRDGTPATAK